MNDNKHDFNNLDYEQLNSLLANPDFANWYYQRMFNKSNNEVSIEDFVGILQEYSNNNLQ